MPEFRVKAIHRKTGREGTIKLEARNEKDARNQVHEDGYLVKSVKMIPEKPVELVQENHPEPEVTEKKGYDLKSHEAAYSGCLTVFGVLTVLGGLAGGLGTSYDNTVWDQIYGVLWFIAGLLVFVIVLLIRIASTLIHIAKHT